MCQHTLPLFPPPPKNTDTPPNTHLVLVEGVVDGDGVGAAVCALALQCQALAGCKVLEAQDADAVGGSNLVIIRRVCVWGVCGGGGEAAGGVAAQVRERVQP